MFHELTTTTTAFMILFAVMDTIIFDNFDRLATGTMQNQSTIFLSILAFILTFLGLPLMLMVGYKIRLLSLHKKLKASSISLCRICVKNKMKISRNYWILVDTIFSKINLYSYIRKI